MASFMLTFDVEDIYTDENIAHDTLQHIVEILNQYSLTGIFLITGEKMNQIRKNQILLELLTNHSLGFHSTFHETWGSFICSLDNYDWIHGVEKLVAREKEGIERFHSIFGRNPSIFGCPGDAWAPHIPAGLTKLHIPAEIYSPIDNGIVKPVEYCQCLSFGRVDMDLDPVFFDIAASSLEYLLKKKDLVVIRVHPSRFYRKDWWDRTPHSPNIMTHAEREYCLRWFEGFIRELKKLELTCSVPEDYVKEHNPVLSLHCLMEAAGEVLKGEYTFLQRMGCPTLSQVIEGLALIAGRILEGEELPEAIALPFMFGPVEDTDASSSKCTEITMEDLRNCLILLEQARKGVSPCLPSQFPLSHSTISPEVLLYVLSFFVINKYLPPLDTPKTAQIVRSLTKFKRRYFNETYLMHWSWTGLPQGYTSPQQFRLAESQIWTLREPPR